jgi:predicted ATPase/DNA-binding XRE family transcriptional regulator
MRPTSDPETFGAWLKRRRKLLDLTQDDLGRLAGCSGAAIRKFEAEERKPSRELAESLAHTLQIPDPELEAFIQLARGIRPGHFPAVTPAGSTPAHLPPDNLPAPLTSLVDRIHDVAAVSALLSDAAIRWVTLIGPPGIGKTRLSIQTGRQVLPRFADGVWFIDLSPLEQPAHVLPAIIRALSPLGLPASLDPDQLAGALKNRSLLLILDNFEHVTEAAIEAAALLKTCAGLKLLATSRIPLHIYGEHEYRVPPLSIPPAQAARQPASLLDYEAVQLFVARARQHQPGFAITPESAPAVIDICTTLEGMPLALELAAASLQRMTLPEMDSRLRHLEGESWIQLFGTPARDLPARQRTLENVVAWSYDLLTDPQREFFCKLGLFSGWFDLEAALEICFDNPRPSPGAVRELLDALSDHSLLVRDNPGRAPRWRMLEIIHEYASLKLEAMLRSGLEPRFAQYFLQNSRARQTQPEFIVQNAGNLHAALKWFIRAGKTEDGFQLAECLDDLWSNHGYYKEGLDLLKQLFSLPDGAPPPIRANRLRLASDLAWQVHDFDTALAFAREAAEIGRIHGLSGEQVAYLNRLGRIHMERGHFAQARQAMQECFELAIDNPASLNPAVPLAQLGELSLFEGRLDESASQLEQALTRLTAEDGIFQGMVKTDLSEIALARADFASARHWLAQAASHARLHMRRTIVFLCAVSGYLILKPASRPADLLAAARLYGASDTLAEHSGIILGPFYHQLNGQRIQLARQQMPNETWQREYNTGKTWNRETALAAASKALE